MGAPNAGTVSDSHRDTVTELVEDGMPFERVVSLIDELTDLSEDARAALWLIAYTKSDAVKRRHV